MAQSSSYMSCQHGLGSTELSALRTVPGKFGCEERDERYDGFVVVTSIHPTTSAELNEKRIVEITCDRFILVSTVVALQCRLMVVVLFKLPYKYIYYVETQRVVQLHIVSCK
jgi:hypothetical protein